MSTKPGKFPGIKAAVVEREGGRTVRFYGEELAAVAGVSKQACLDALRAIVVEATPLPFVVKEETAKNPDSPRVWPDAPNLAEPNVKEKGDVDKAFAGAAAVVEGFFTTPVQVHHPLETHGNTVSVTNDGVTCWASTQGIFSVRDGLASYLDVPRKRFASSPITWAAVSGRNSAPARRAVWPRGSPRRRARRSN